jgi:hypothetical protein
MPIPALDTPEVSAHFDEELRIIMIKYGSQITPQVTATTYQWLFMISEMPEIMKARGSIYDFSEVKTFSVGNLSAVKDNSAKFNNEDPRLKNHPVALIIGNNYQRQAVMASLGVTQQQKRKKIVTSRDQALLFIKSWRSPSTRV